MMSPNNINKFVSAVHSDVAISINTAIKGSNGNTNSRKPYGVQSVEPLFCCITSLDY